MSRQHHDATTEADVATKDGGHDNRSALKLLEVWIEEAAKTQADVATED